MANVESVEFQGRESIKEELKQTIGSYFMRLKDNVEII